MEGQVHEWGHSSVPAESYTESLGRRSKVTPALSSATRTSEKRRIQGNLAPLGLVLTLKSRQKSEVFSSCKSCLMFPAEGLLGFTNEDLILSV